MSNHKNLGAEPTSYKRTLDISITFYHDDEKRLTELLRQYEKLHTLKWQTSESDPETGYNYVSQLEMDVDREIDELLKELRHLIKSEITGEQILVALNESERTEYTTEEALQRLFG